MLSRSSRGASNNRLIPTTEFIAISLKDNVLTLMSNNDETTYLYVRDTDVKGDDFYVCVNTDILVKLISKLTSDEITFELFDNYLGVKANGNYKLPIQIDESTDKPIHISSPLEDEENIKDMKEIGAMSLSDVKTILNGLKSSVATTMEQPQYAHYYFGNQVIGTDTIVASAYDKSLLNDGVDARLINVHMVNLLDVMSDDTIKIMANDTKIMFVSDRCTIYSTMPYGIEDYAIDALNGLFNQQFDNKCSVSTAVLSSALERIKLFVGKFDDGEIILNFTDSDIQISSKLNTGVEKIPYTDKDIHVDEFTASININNLADKVRSFTSDKVEIQYGISNAIKLVDTEVITIIALITD